MRHLWIASISALGFATFARAENPALLVDGKSVEPAAGMVRTVHGFFVVPVEGVADVLGITLTERGNRLVVSRSKHSVQLVAGSMVAKADGRIARMPLPVRSSGGSTFVPLRFLVESLGGSLHYDKAAGTLAIQTEETGGTCGLKVVGWR